MGKPLISGYHRDSDILSNQGDSEGVTEKGRSCPCWITGFKLVGGSPWQIREVGAEPSPRGDEDFDGDIGGTD